MNEIPNKVKKVAGLTFQLVPWGTYWEFPTKEKADELAAFLRERGPEVGCIDVFNDPHAQTWIVTQYFRMMRVCD